MQTAFKEYTREVTFSKALSMLKRMQSVNMESGDYCIYVSGDTFKSKQAIQLLAHQLPIEIKTITSSKKGLLKMLPIPSPHYFIIKIHQLAVLAQFYQAINDISIMTFCIFNQRFESIYLTSMLKEGQATYIEPIYQDSRYFAYGIDTDDQKSATGFREFVSYGIDAPKELVGLLE